MKKLTFFVCILFIIGCISTDSNGIVHSSSNYYKHVQAGHVIIDIEECEYIYFHHAGNYGEGVLTHKGNCKNPIHCYNKLE